MNEYYFLFKIDLNKELTLYSFNPGIVKIGKIVKNSIQSSIVGNYNGRIIAIDNTNNGVEYSRVFDDIQKICKNYKICEIEKYKHNIILAGYIITNDPEIETKSIHSSDLNISKYFKIEEIDGINKISYKDIYYKGYEDSILRDIKLKDLGI